LNTLIFNIAQKEEAAIEYTANGLLDSYQYALNDTFERPFEDIQFRFAKSFTTMIVKTCKCKELMKHVDENTLEKFLEQLCMRMLLPGL
jgi:hypothetical protein